MIESIGVISMWQPWATLWLLGKCRDPRYCHPKLHETRSRNTTYRGRLLVLATKKRDGEVKLALRDPVLIATLAAHGLTPEGLAFGAIIGECDVEYSEVMTPFMIQNQPPESPDRRWGNWKAGRYAYGRGPSPILYPTPLPATGHQGSIRRVSVDVLRASGVQA